MPQRGWSHFKTNIREVGTANEGTNDEDKHGAAMTLGAQKLEPELLDNSAQVAPGPPQGAVTVHMKAPEGQGHGPLLPAFGLAGKNRLVVSGAHLPL